VIKNVDMKDMILVDNAIYSFGFQLSNGIPIIPFKHDKTDSEFMHLMKFLCDCAIHNLDDLREPLKASFHFQELYDHYNFDDFIKYYDYQECELEHEEDERFEQEWLESQALNGRTGNLQPPLQKSVQESLDGLQRCFDNLKSNIYNYVKV